MILSHRYRFIFLKTRKTAGTSVEVSLSRYCGARDVLTPVCAEGEALRAGLGLVPRNYGPPLSHYSFRDLLRLLLRGQPKPGRWFYNHMTAREVRERVGARIWGSYFKFCFERDPWDKVLSQYHFDPQGQPDLDAFVRRADLWSDFDRYTLDGELAVDFLGRYETLAADLGAVCRRLGIPFDGWLPRAKGGFRQDRRPPAEVYTPRQAELVAERFAREIRLLGYRFGGRFPPGPPAFTRTGSSQVTSPVLRE
jgi:hypothetical protein